MKNLKKKTIVLVFVLMIWALAMTIISPPEGTTVSPDEDINIPLERLSYLPSGRLLDFCKSCEDEVIQASITYNNIEKVTPGDYSTSYLVLYDATNSQILYEKNANDKCFPASTTKLLTACVAAQYCNFDTVFTVGDELNFVAWDSSVACLQKGQQLTFEALLDALLLPSGNDAAYIMAAGVGRIYSGDDSLGYAQAVEVFCELMNKTAQRIGAINSHFTCPDGYHDDNHYTTAMDMMKIGLYASSFEVVRNSYAKYEAEHTLITGERMYWENSNPLINPYSAYYCKNATGMKTGFTDQAGSCLVASAEQDGIKLIAVALNSTSIYERNCDLTELFAQGFKCIDNNAA